MAAIGRVAEPQARGIGDEQILAQHVLADRRQIASKAAVLGHGRAEGIAHELRRLAAGLQQSRRTVVGVGVELEGIGLASVDAAHDEVDALQSLERLQENAVARRPQVAGLH